jgi:hypothetical protein
MRTRLQCRHKSFTGRTKYVDIEPNKLIMRTIDLVSPDGDWRGGASFSAQATCRRLARAIDAEGSR